MSDKPEEQQQGARKHQPSFEEILQGVHGFLWQPIAVCLERFLARLHFHPPDAPRARVALHNRGVEDLCDRLILVREGDIRLEMPLVRRHPALVDERCTDR